MASMRHLAGPFLLAAGLFALLVVTTPVALRGAGTAPHPSTRHVAFDDLTPAAVTGLRLAWTAHAGEFAGGAGPSPAKPVEGFQTRPVLVDDVLVFTTTTSKVIAVDAETGAERWRVDPFAGRDRVCDRPHRGVAVWPGDREHGATIFSGTCDGHLVAIDARGGRLAAAFGVNGLVDLRAGVGAAPADAFGVTSAPVVFRDLVIVGSLVPEEEWQGPSGDVRAFDVRTGREAWRFHTVPQPGEANHDAWPGDSWRRRTGVNVWSQMTVDEERGLVFLPIGSASYDFYGADRPGTNLYANCLVALDAATGAVRWHYQMVHHDLWDYDPPAQPILAEIPRDGRPVPVVIQLTKMGLVFVLDRLTGQPFFGVEERPVAASAVPGEHSSPTQPFPLKPPPLARVTPITRADLNTIDETATKECAALFDGVATKGGVYTPEGTGLTLWFPGTLGGATWSGGTVDPGRGLLVVNTNEVGAIGRMEPQPPGSTQAYRRASPWGAYTRFWDSRHVPCQQPPWGKLTAIDLAHGTIAWQIPFGLALVLGEKGRTTGTPNLGGAVSTSGGVTFIGATNDQHFRAFETATGRLLWDVTLPASGHATPLVYRGPRSGKAYVAIAAGGGGRFSAITSDAVVAYVLGAGQ
jgi:quinoprotein glucose dehydrogenase